MQKKWGAHAPSRVPTGLSALRAQAGASPVGLSARPRHQTIVFLDRNVVGGGANHRTRGRVRSPSHLHGYGCGIEDGREVSNREAPVETCEARVLFQFAVQTDSQSVDSIFSRTGRIQRLRRLWRHVSLDWVEKANG
jgi:hypothetical protein